MAPFFHFIDTNVLLDSFPGNMPTEDDYEKFKKPDLSSKQELELHRELADVVQSVSSAAGCDVLRFLDTTKLKASSGDAKKDIFTDGGIYRDSPLACDTPELTPSNRNKTQVTLGELGFRLQHCIDVPFWVSLSQRHARMIYFESHSHTKDNAPPSSSSPDQASAADQLGGAMDRSSEGQRRSGDVDVTRPLDDKEGVEGAITEAATGDPRGLSGGGVITKPRMTEPHAPSFVKLSRRGKEILDQFAEYMLNLLKYQHRTFSYAACVCYDMARLFYFDRSGVLVTEPFRWDERDSLLHRFIWKIAQLASAGRFEGLGYDPTATLASGEAKDKFLALKDDKTLPQHVREGFKKAIADGSPVYKLEVTPAEPSDDEWFSDMPFPPPKEFGSPSTAQSQSSPLSDSESSPSGDPLQPPQHGARSFLVGRPHFTADKLVGRCTRGYFAYDVTDADKRNWRVCFLKDSWRPVVPGRTRPEHLVYQRLRFFGVDRGIGTLICGGDVGGHWAQRTCAQDYLSAGENDSRAVVRVHYRLVIEEIGIPLNDFASFPELSAILVDAICAHHEAWDLAKVLHCDISVGNIMILPATAHSLRRTGILIDWDLSRLESELETGPGPAELNRMGTWQFRSALWLALPWKPYRRTDDIESFIHVYLYLVLRYHVTSLNSLHLIVSGYFDSVSVVHGIKVGGDSKLAHLNSHRLPFHVKSNPALQRLLDAIFFACSQSYNTLDLSEMHRRYGFRVSPPSPQPRATGETAPVPDLVLSDSDSDDDMPRSNTCATLIRPTPRRRAGPDEDVSVVEGILSDVGDLVDLFAAHATHPRQDKACDQFVARQHEVVYQPIRALSTSGESETAASSRSASSSFGG
ncbi:hypothetical protein GSI_07602 [Ganoderma sinense ZZ0214-1]|uniref:Fungal-type protein kinase domain-containing protein n=1 Tax=Ganoderma sinense ZZ0214-1 TaxID=1077348 RepID=A0A2G8S9I4_9APHY|nr:hypothetical protein GSI_07602 [Ganoderma sinense ZZ0214-1]